MACKFILQENIQRGDILISPDGAHLAAFRPESGHPIGVAKRAGVKGEAVNDDDFIASKASLGPAISVLDRAK